MPNNITNKLIFKGDQETINRLKEAIKSENMAIDYSKIIPIPDNIYQGSLGEKEQKLYGKNNWYDWNRENWGTKWNAYCITENGNEIIFDSAWCAPHPVILALSNKYPNIEIEHKWADEDSGCGTGSLVYKSGSACGGYYENESPEAYEVYIELKGQSDCLYKDELGQWQRYNCDVCPHKC